MEKVSSEKNDSGGATGQEHISLEVLENRLGHCFAHQTLLEQAITHSSMGGIGQHRHADRRGVEKNMNYERLEFLGDRVLGLVIAEWLLERFPHEPEGGLAKRHTALVRREALTCVADSIGLGDFLRLSPGEAAAGGRRNQTFWPTHARRQSALCTDAGLEA
ncbi:hypothetical protein CCP2SC5_1700003 [Azospirillaceae bacterium]